MKITKYGHCCLLVETAGVRIMTDPGFFSTAQNNAEQVDAVLITHEHGDHLHADSLKEVLAHNPHAVVITNTSVGKILEKERIAYTAVSNGGKMIVKGVEIEGYGTRHAEIYKEFGQVENTGYFIGGALFYPGDAFYDPKRPVDILALPVAGPWMRVKDAVEYALRIKPRVAFPVHDGVYVHPALGSSAPSKYLPEAGIDFVTLNAGETKEL